jgi:hypothetical protein
MGNDTSIGNDLRNKKILQDYQMLNKQPDPRVGDIVIYQHKFTKQLIALKEFKANNKQEVTSYQ